MKQVAEYIIPIIQDGKNCVPDFLQAKELIRCKECKHRYNGKDDSPCELLNMPLGLSEDFYCMFAERKPPQVNPKMVKALLDRIEKQRGEG